MAAAAELNRADGKAGILLGWVGAAVALVTAAVEGHQLSVASAVLEWAGDALLIAAIVCLLAAVRPHLRDGTGWIRYARLDAQAAAREAENITTAATEAAARRAGDLAQIAYTKYLRLRIAVDLLFIAGALLVVGLLLAL